MSAEKTAAILLDELSPKFDGYRRALQQSAAVIVQLEDRVKALEARQPERGEQGEPGPAPTSEQIAKALESYLSENPPPKGDPGPQGDQGEKGDPGPGPTGDQIAKAVAEYIAANPPAKGEKGEPGRDADPIDIADVCKELLTMPELSTLVSLHASEAVAKYFEANPVRDGKDGAPGPQGEKGDPGPAGKDGADGLALREFLRSQDGHLHAVLSDGTTRDLGEIQGKDGRDGVSLESFDLAYDDAQHEIVVRATAGSTTKELRFPAGGIHYRGYWRDGVQAKGGEAWTHDGILWVAKRTTSAKPCVENKDDWGIGARKGKDGRDGRNGRDLGPPHPVKLKDDGESE
jgi:hypothetical protein